jgi:hypothetical protein
VLTVSACTLRYHPLTSSVGPNWDQGRAPAIRSAWQWLSKGAAPLTESVTCRV